jgi:serine/threonine protein kinase
MFKTFSRQTGKPQLMPLAVQEAVDVWSLGVMAFELLTGVCALPMHEGKEQVCSGTFHSNSSPHA